MILSFRYIIFIEWFRGEAGEVQNDVKLIRKLHDGGDIRDENIDKIKDELGDVLWYIFALSNKLKIPFKILLIII